MNEFNLTDKQKDLILAFKENTELFDTVYTVLLAGVYQNGVVQMGAKHDPKQNWALAALWNRDNDISNEALGESIKATAEGIRFIESSFQKMRNLQRETVVAEKVNKAL